MIDDGHYKGWVLGLPLFFKKGKGYNKNFGSKEDQVHCDNFNPVGDDCQYLEHRFWELLYSHKTREVG